MTTTPPTIQQLEALLVLALTVVRSAMQNPPAESDPPTPTPHRGKQRARPEAVILANAVYESAELEARLGRTLWRRIRKAVQPLVRGRYMGAAVQAALDSDTAGRYRVVDIHGAAPEREARKGKPHAKSTGTMQVRITR